MNGTPENLDLTKCIAFTWSPKPVPIIDPFLQYVATLSLIKNLDRCAEYRIYPELNKQGNIHYHGIIHITDKVKWYKSVLPQFKYNGYVVIKTDPDDGWLKYIIKDAEVMSAILKINLPLIQNPKDKRKKLIKHPVITRSNNVNDIIHNLNIKLD